MIYESHLYTWRRHFSISAIECLVCILSTVDRPYAMCKAWCLAINLCFIDYKMIKVDD